VREVNHRAKNMLSLVQAIARQSAARESEDSADTLLSASRRSLPIRTC
jgi:two-component sensor histidine kinase